MSTAAIPEPLNEDDLPVAPRRRHRNPAHAVFAFFHNKTVGLGLILAMALATLVGVLNPQVSDAVLASPEEYQGFLDSVRPRYRGLTDPLSAIGAFHAFSTWWFRAIAVLLALSIAACTLHRLPRLWQLATKPHLHVTRSFFSHARLHDEVSAPTAPAATVERATAELHRRGFRVVTAPERTQGVTELYADRFRFMPFGTVLAHLAFILILVGVLVSSVTGFREDNFVAPVGMPQEIGHGTGLTLEATSFNDSYSETGRPMDYVSHVRLTRDGQLVREQDIRVNTPLRVDGISVNQASFGLAVEVTITDETGRVLTHEGVPLNPPSDEEPRYWGRVKLPDGKVLMIDAPSEAVAGQLQEGQMMLSLFGPDSDVADASQALDPGQSVSGVGLTATFNRERQYTGLMVSRDPGAPIVWLASALLMLGTVATMFLRHHRIWLRIEPREGGATVLMGCPDRPDTVFEGKFRQLAEVLGTQPGEETA